MSKQTTIRIITDDTNGKELTKSITYANPSASNGVLNEFAKKLNNLTTNTLKNVVRVDTEDITDAEGEGDTDAEGEGDTDAEGEVTPEVDTGTYTYQLNASTKVYNINEANSSVTLTMTTTAPQGTGEWDFATNGDMEFDTEQRSGNTITVRVGFDDLTKRTETLKIQLVSGSAKLTNFVQFVFKIS